MEGFGMTRILTCLLVCLSLWSSAALASDGRLEINHVCASGAGCFPGDGSGYPVEITEPGSYRLTINLTVPAGKSGILLSGNGIDIDLGGFEVAGPVSCSGGSGCPAVSTGSGIEPAGAGGERCAVSNGKIRGFGRDGVELPALGRVEGVTITEVSRFGIYLSYGGFAARNLIQRTGQHGMYLEPLAPVVPLYERNTIFNTGLQSVRGGKASGPNSCADQLCGTSGKKFFYLTSASNSAHYVKSEDRPDEREAPKGDR
jgi:hypothetical protein